MKKSLEFHLPHFEIPELSSHYCMYTIHYSDKNHFIGPQFYFKLAAIMHIIFFSQNSFMTVKFLVLKNVNLYFKIDSMQQEEVVKCLHRPFSIKILNYLVDSFRHSFSKELSYFFAFFTFFYHFDSLVFIFCSYV